MQENWLPDIDGDIDKLKDIESEASSVSAPAAIPVPVGPTAPLSCYECAAAT